MPQQIDSALKQLLLTADFRPAITLWNRLEGRPRKEEFERSLSAEIRDPLWMLTRQWQFGEFKGEDAGSAVKARVQLNTSRIDRYAVKSENPLATGGEKWEKAVPYDISLPLETEVEREPLLDSGPDGGGSSNCLAVRSQMGRQWMRLLKQAGMPELKSAFLERFGFEDVSEKPDPSKAEQLEASQLQSDPAAWQSLRAVRGRLPDGHKLLAAIESGDFELWVEDKFDSASWQALKDLGRIFRTWFYRLYSQPQAEIEDAWAPSYLEYQFAVSAPEDESGAGRALLVAEQYHQGHLDWYAFDVDRESHLEDLPGASFSEDSFEVRAPLAFLLTHIEFNGMPNVRWWEFEDRRTDFGSIRAGTTDIPLLMLAEFGLIYGNDWNVIPYNLEVGTLAEIKGIIVTDVFGVRTLIRAAGQGQRMNWQKWSMYSLAGTDAADHRLWLPPSVAKIQESYPIEKVTLARDEMTNMVWGIEERIPGMSGNGVDGFEAATALSEHFSQRAPQTQAGPTANEAKIRYVLGTTVPENWIPFIGRHNPGSNRQIRLQRASMPRLTDALPNTRIEPRGKILRTGLDVAGDKKPYFLHEEEVPRAGVIVTRSFQRARWFDGKVYTWIGRRKQTGRGEGASGLAFDQIVPLETKPGSV
ncbi:MAG TPA: hypothetical protein VF735_18065 [Pyrinomonadaceae bacterium]|jgi:hypothetical protein